jgi:hypothetical protein
MKHNCPKVIPFPSPDGERRLLLRFAAVAIAARAEDADTLELITSLKDLDAQTLSVLLQFRRRLARKAEAAKRRVGDNQR